MLRLRHLPIFALFIFVTLFSGCDYLDRETGTEEPTIYDYRQPGGPRDQDRRVPPTPPIVETFDGQPQLSLFPRVGDYRPEKTDERYPFWRTFIDHFVKVSGLVQNPETDNRAWSFRGINTIDSAAWFSPVGVAPNTVYRISYRLKTDFPEDAKTGIGVLEFDTFLWHGEQYTEETVRDHLVGSQVGIEIRENVDWEEKSFSFETGPNTAMIHLIFYREGEHSRTSVLIDDIEIRKAVTNNEQQVTGKRSQAIEL